MGWTVTTRWLNPPNWDGTAENSRVRHAAVIINGITDATVDLTDYIAVDISNLQTHAGAECTKTSIRHMSWDITGLTSLTVKFDRSPEETIAILSDTGSEDYRHNPIQDTGQVGDGTGDIMINTAGGSANDVFTLRLEFKVK